MAIRCGDRSRRRSMELVDGWGMVVAQVSQELLDEVALSRAEYEAIVDRLERPPNDLEIGSVRGVVERALRL